MNKESFSDNLPPPGIPEDLRDIEVEGKTSEELDELRHKILAVKVEDMNLREAEFLGHILERIDSARENPKQVEVDENESASASAEKEKAKITKQSKRIKEKELTEKEIRESITNYPIEQISDEELVIHGNYLIKSMDWARVNRKPELVKELNERLQEIKKEIVEFPIEKTVQEPEAEKTIPENTEIGAIAPKEIKGVESIEPEPTEKEAQELIGDVVTEGLFPEQAGPMREEVEKKWPELIKEKVMGISVKDILRQMVSKEGLSNIGTGMGTGLIIKAGLQAAVGISGLGLSVAGGAIAAPARKLGMAGWKQVGYLESRKALNRGDAGAILHRVKGQGLDRVNKLSPLDALKLIADRKKELGEGADGYDVVEEIEKKVNEYAERLGGLKGKDRLDEYIRLAELVEDEDTKKKKSDVLNELAVLSGRRVTTKDLRKSVYVGAFGGFIGGLIGSYFHHGNSEVVNSAHNKVGAVLVAKPSINSISHPDTATHLSAPRTIESGGVKGTLPSTAPHAAPSIETPPHVPDSNDVWSQGAVASEAEARAHDLARVAEALHAQTLATHSMLPVHEIGTAELSHELGVSEEVYKSIDPSHTTVGDAINKIADASAPGDPVKDGIALFKIDPTSADMDMSVEDFLKHRLMTSGTYITPGAEMNISHLDTITSMPVHEVPISHVDVPHSAPSIPSEVPKMPNLGEAKYNLHLPSQHAALSEPIEVHAPHTVAPAIHTSEVSETPQPDSVFKVEPTKLSFWNRLMGKTIPNEAPTNPLESVMNSKPEVAPNVNSYLNGRDPLVSLSSEVPYSVYEAPIRTVGEESMFNWIFASKLAISGAGALGGTYAGFKVADAMSNTQTEVVKQEVPNEEKLKEEMYKRIDATTAFEDIKKLSEKERGIKVLRLVSSSLSKKELAGMEVALEKRRMFEIYNFLFPLATSTKEKDRKIAEEARKIIATLPLSKHYDIDFIKNVAKTREESFDKEKEPTK